MFEDNTALLQTFQPGQVVQMLAQIPIPHEGPMNVSVVQTSNNTILGDALITFASYADEKLKALPANNTNFNVTLPALPDGACVNGGDCVLQWFWFGVSASQTYESCTDFVLASIDEALTGF